MTRDQVSCGPTGPEKNEDPALPGRVFEARSVVSMHGSQPHHTTLGRPHVLVVESLVASAFVLLAAVAITGQAWLLVAGLLGHGAYDLWQHRTGFVNGTRWWPPFCVAVDWVAALLLAVMLTLGISMR